MIVAPETIPPHQRRYDALLTATIASSFSSSRFEGGQHRREDFKGLSQPAPKAKDGEQTRQFRQTTHQLRLSLTSGGRAVFEAANGLEFTPIHPGRRCG